MFLVKCKCGCMFTLKDLKLPRVTCQSCLASIDFNKNSSFSSTGDALNEAGVSVSCIPDSAKITVSFEA